MLSFLLSAVLSALSATKEVVMNFDVSDYTLQIQMEIFPSHLPRSVCHSRRRTNRLCQYYHTLWESRVIARTSLPLLFSLRN